MIEVLCIPNKRFIRVTMGDGDLILGNIQNTETGLWGFALTDNPNGVEDFKTTHEELKGQKVQCTSEVGIEIMFRSVEDVDKLMDKLARLRSYIMEG